MTEGKLSSNLFEVQYSDAGITGLNRVADRYDTNYIVRRGALGELAIGIAQLSWVVGHDLPMAPPPLVPAPVDE